MLPRSVRFLSKCVEFTVVASTIAFGFPYFHLVEESSAHSDAVAADHDGQPEKPIFVLTAHTRQTKSGPIIRLQWDPSAEPIRRSSYAMLYIYDGVAPPRNIPLQGKALQAGFTDYSPKTDEVTFHFSLQGSRSEGQFVLVVLGATPFPISSK